MMTTRLLRDKFCTLHDTSCPLHHIVDTVTDHQREVAALDFHGTEAEQ